MAAETSDVILFKSRSLAGRLSASFKFLNANLSLLLRLGTYIVLPVAVVEALYMAFFGAVPQAGAGAGYLAASAVAFLVAVAGSCFFSSLVYTLLRGHAETGSLPAYRLKDLKQPLLANARKVFFSGLLLFAVGLLCGALAVGLAVLTPYTLILTVPLAVFILVPLGYLTYIYIFEDVPLTAAVVKSYKLGIPTWGAAFSVLLISYLLALVIQVVACLPWYTAVMVENLAYVAQMRGEGGVLPGFFPYLMFFLVLAGTLISFLANMLVLSAMGYQYGSAETKRKALLAETNQLL